MDKQYLILVIFKTLVTAKFNCLYQPFKQVLENETLNQSCYYVLYLPSSFHKGHDLFFNEIHRHVDVKADKIISCLRIKINSGSLNICLRIERPSGLLLVKRS